MASQSATLSVGFAQSCVGKKSGAAVASLQCGALESANRYTGGSGLLASNRNKYKLPSANVPFGTVQPDGSVMVNPNWYRVLDYVVNTQLGGLTGPTLGDITTTVDATRSSAIDAQNAVSVVAQTVNANANALAATVQVSQTNALTGASQIPRVTYTNRGVQP